MSVDPRDMGEPLIQQDGLWLPIADEPIEAFIAVLGDTKAGLYAGTEGHGVLRFSVADRAWHEANVGLPTNEHVFVHDLLNLEGDLWAATSHGVFRLPGDSETWEGRNGPIADFYATAIAASEEWLFAGTWEGRIFRSPDRGENWEQVYDHAMHGKSDRLPLAAFLYLDDLQVLHGFP